MARRRGASSESIRPRSRPPAGPGDPPIFGYVLRVILNDDHLPAVLGEALRCCRHRLFIATADVKDLHVPPEGARAGGRARSIVAVFDKLAGRGIEVRPESDGKFTGLADTAKLGVSSQPPGLCEGVDPDDSAGLLDLMEPPDAAC